MFTYERPVILLVSPMAHVVEDVMLDFWSGCHGGFQTEHRRLLQLCYTTRSFVIPDINNRAQRWDFLSAVSKSLNN